MTGPIVTRPSSSPSPTTIRSHAATTPATNASWTLLCTKILFAQMHVWPALRNLAAIAPSTARLMSASSHTISGALPPNSIAVRFTVSAQPRMRALPTRVLPVKDNLRTSKLSTRADPIALASPTTTFNAPRGMPAASASWHKARAEKGVSSLGFTTAVQPAAKAPAAARVTIAEGKFQGVMMPTTPTGRFTTVVRTPPRGSGTMSP